MKNFRVIGCLLGWTWQNDFSTIFLVDPAAMIDWAGYLPNKELGSCREKISDLMNDLLLVTYTLVKYMTDSHNLTNGHFWVLAWLEQSVNNGNFTGGRWKLSRQPKSCSDKGISIP